MIHLVRLCFTLNPIDDPLHNETMFAPTLLMKRVAKPLGALRLSTTRADNLLDANFELRAALALVAR